MITVAQLQDQTHTDAQPAILYCEVCGQECSANKSDYFWLPLDHVFMCCNEPMQLVVERITYELVDECEQEDVGMTADQSVCADIRRLRDMSEQAWDTAVECVGPKYGGSKEKAAKMQSLADECLASYDAAITTLEEQYANWQQYARQHLQAAQSMESEGGDSSHANIALGLLLLGEYLAEDM